MDSTENPYLEIFFEFNENDIKYLIVGGYAAILYGANRMTKDMDIIIDLEKNNLKKCLGILKKNDFILSHPYIKENEVTPENLLKWIDEKNMKALRFESKSQPFLMIDLILDIPKEFEILYKKGHLKRTKDNCLYFINKGDLIEMKSNAGRLQDYQDNFAMTGDAVWLEKLKEEFSNDKR